jgi:Fur family ferric uptake transcriptional regulator
VTTAPFDRERMHALFTAPAAELDADSERAEVFLVGGAAMALVYDRARATRDLAAVFAPTTAVRRAASAVAAREGLADDWLNDAVKGFVPGPDADARRYFEAPGLVVDVASPEYRGRGVGPRRAGLRRSPGAPRCGSCSRRSWRTSGPPMTAAPPAFSLDSFKIERQGGAVPARDELTHHLRAAALRVTRPRLAVLEAVHAHPHADTDTVIRAARERLASVSHQAVYDVLRALTDAGLVRRIQPTGSVARYEARTGDNHHHVVCRVCGTVADVDCSVGHAPCLTASDDRGFAIDEAEVVYWGRCPACTAT